MNHNSFALLTKHASEKIQRGKLDDALQVIHEFVEQIITEPLCTYQIFGSKALDGLCQDIGRRNLEISKISPTPVISSRDHPVYVYLVTKIQNSGGHTRIIEDIIRARPDAQHIILSTELIGRSDSDYLINGLCRSTRTTFEQAPAKSYHKRLTWLQLRLLTINPTKVYLFNHHQDCISVAAIQPEMNFVASFYHHGDHHLCLGVFLSHLDHIDPHPMGYHNCRDSLGIDNIYIPLTVEDKGCRAADLPFLHFGTLTTCTAARSNKIEIPYYVSYLDLLPELLKSTGGRHLHIGRLTPWALLKIRWGLKRNGISAERFIYLPWVSSVWKALHEYRVDLYVASFPYGGGLTLIEAMGAGIPVALHRHIFSRTLSGIDLAYSNAFSWRSPEKLLHYCASVSSGDLEKGSRLGRMQYEKFHSPRILQGILNDAVNDYPTPADLSDKFSVDTDEWVLWMERQLTIKRVFTRAAYRMFRRIRAWW